MDLFDYLRQDLTNRSDRHLDRWIKNADDGAKITFMNFLIRNDTTRSLLLNLLGQEQQNYIKLIEDSLAAHVRTTGPNPWTDLAITACKQPRAEQGRIQEYHSIDKPQSTGCFPLENLPTELILEIVRHLPRESAGALAVVNWNFRAILRMERLKPLPLCGYNTYWKYLQLLERDIDPDLFVVACPGCVRLHSVFIPGQGREGNICPLHASSRSDDRFLSLFPPSQPSLNYNFVRALAIQKARGIDGAANCARLLKHLSETRTSHSKFRKAVFTSDHSFTTSDELLIHNQIIYAPHGEIGGVTGKSFHLLFNIVAAFRPCEHLTWMRDSLFDYESLDEGLGIGRSMLTSFNKHLIPAAYAARILGDNSWTYKIIFGDGTPISARKTSCPECPTVCSVQAQDIPGVGRVILFKTQRNLGGLGHVSGWDSKLNGEDRDGQGGAAATAAAAATTVHPSKWKWDTYHSSDVQRAVDPRGLIPTLAGCPLQDGDNNEDNFDTLGVASEVTATFPSSSISFSPGRRNFQQLMDMLNATGNESSDSDARVP